jgi:hypothetical protein
MSEVTRQSDGSDLFITRGNWCGVSLHGLEWMVDFKFILGVETVLWMWKSDGYKKQYDC